MNAAMPLALVSLAMCLTPADPRPDCSSPEVVLERYLSALGGHDAIRQIHRRVSEATETEPSSFNPDKQNTYRYLLKWRTPNKVVARNTHIVPIFLIPVPFGSATFIFDGARWSDAQGHAVTEPRWRRQEEFVSPDEAMKRIAADPLMPARPGELYFAFDTAGDRSSYRGRCVLHAFGHDGRTDTLHFDGRTGLLRTWDLEMPQPHRRSYTIRFDFDDYRQVGPVRFPFFLYCDFYKASFKFTKVTHNPPLPDSDFEVKPDGA